MKVRNDYVSNSSSCSFIIHVANEDDLKQLSKPKVRAGMRVVNCMLMDSSF